MSNIVQFPSVVAGFPRASGHLAARVLGEPAPHAHVVQFYDDDRFLFETVAFFLRAGLEAGDAALVIATPAHTEGILNQLDEELRAQAMESGLLVSIDADAMLARFMADGEPIEPLFIKAVDRIIKNLLACVPVDAPAPRRVRAFGEMVDVLWKQNKAAAAVQLEAFWHRASAQHQLVLLCAYAMRNFYKVDDMAPFGEVCRLHTHVLPTERFARDGGDIFERMRDISELEQRARLLPNEVQYRQELEGALREAVEERERIELELRASMEREREARMLARASSAFREVLSSLLDPLSTVLTTARMMATPRERPLDPETLARWAATGTQLHRRIEQVLDLAKDRLSDGMSVKAEHDRDVLPLIAGAVEAVRVIHPRAQIRLCTDERCRAPIDPGRFRQVLLNLLRNALEHGDTVQPVTIKASARGPQLKVSVHNSGPPIDPAALPFLFDPFRRPRARRDSAAGLGLGLYLSERIVANHGGTIEVRSSAEEGTTFEVVLPRFH